MIILPQTPDGKKMGYCEKCGRSQGYVPKDATNIICFHCDNKEDKARE